MILIRNWGDAIGRAVEGEWLESFDPDGNDGFGAISFTSDIAKAMRFRDLDEAFATWKQQSKVRPLRSDMRPNRPLTAYNITFDDAPP
jgi:hypothetical protein